MKRIIIIILVLVFSLSACAAQPGSSSSTESTTLSSEKTTTKDYGTNPSYEEVIKDINAYSRMFYANNQNYKWNCVKTTRENKDGCVVGYFDGEAVVKMEVETWGERPHWYTTYYFINDNLTYIKCRLTLLYLPPFQEEYKEYFLIDGKVWQLDEEMLGLIEASDTSNSTDLIKEVDFFEQDKRDLIGDKPIVFAKNTFTHPTAENLFIQFNNAKNDYFRKLFAGDKYDKKYFKVDLPDYLPEKENADALFSGSKLRKLYLCRYYEKTYSQYEYYPIDDTNIYVVINHQEAESINSDFLKSDSWQVDINEITGTQLLEYFFWQVDINELTKNYFEEYFIVDGKVMVYDLQKMDLVESADDSYIYTQYQTAVKQIQE